MFYAYRLCINNHMLCIINNYTRFVIQLSTLKLLVWLTTCIAIHLPSLMMTVLLDYIYLSIFVCRHNFSGWTIYSISMSKTTPLFKSPYISRFGKALSMTFCMCNLFSISLKATQFKVIIIIINWKGCTKGKYSLHN